MRDQPEGKAGKPVFILGISCFYHDSAAAILCDGVIVAAAQEERFTRRKHDAGFPSHAVAYCLKQAGITASDLAIVAFYDKPFLKFERILETSLSYAPLGLRSFLTSMPLWLKEKLWISSLIRDELTYDGVILFPEHHESHAASAFFPSPFERAAFLTIDGVGEWTTTSYGRGAGNELEILGEMRFPHSLGLLYSAFTYYTGFKVNSAEYKVMGLAPYGEPVYVNTIYEQLIDLKEDGSFRMNMEFFDYCAGLRMTGRKFAKLFSGPTRKPESPLTQREMDLARSLQDVTEEIMLRMARHVHKETGETNLVLAGGVALNCVGNGRILREGPFKNLWIQPAAGDAGGALGAAMYAWHVYMGKPRTADGAHDIQCGSFLGPEYSDEEIGRFLVDRGIRAKKLDRQTLFETVADRLAQEHVVGWFQGRMEFGPRALGNRSILGDARSQSMQSLINQKIKFRESFRPFAPAVLRERSREYFEIDVESPYMLLVANVRKERRLALTADQEGLRGFDKLMVARSDIPAVTHVDNSARLQTVDRERHPLLHGLISEFEEKTGCPVIINTSLNVRGEPIVCTPEEAYRCFMRTEMDDLVLGSYLLTKSGQPRALESTENVRQWHLFDGIKATPTNIRKFGLLFGVIGILVAIALLIKGSPLWPWGMAVGAMFIVAAYVWSSLLRPFYIGWMVFATVLGWASTRLLLGLIFYVVMTPIGILVRLFDKDHLGKRPDRSAASYWIKRDPAHHHVRRCERMF
jgi:carbamoyltransferase